jgi:hypothetical protein
MSNAEDLGAADADDDDAFDDLVDIKTACRIVGGSKPVHPTTIHRFVREGRLSPPLKIGKQVTRFSKRRLLADIARAADAAE